MKYLKDCWYVAALDNEVEVGAMFHRMLLGQSVLMYRKEDGTPVAMRDRCSHRFAPLHLGKLENDTVICPYHGLAFASTGKCIHNPHGDQKLFPGLDIAAYPVVEKDRYLWIWLGDPSLADPALVPAYPMVSGVPEHATGTAYMKIPSDYQILADNIMDLTHADYVHGPLLATQGQLTKAEPEIDTGDRTVKIRWEWKQTPAQGFYVPFLPEGEAEAEQFIQVEWTAPSAMLITGGAVQGTRDFSQGLQIAHNHLLTPETEFTTHYFFGGARSFAQDDAGLNGFLMEKVVEAFMTEDSPLVGAVQEEMGTADLMSLRPAILPCDKAALFVRRKLSALIKAQDERNTPQLAPRAELAEERV